MENEEQISLIDVIADSDVPLTVMSDEESFGERSLAFAWSHIHVECRQQSTGCRRFRQTEKKTPRTLLDDISGVARSGQVVAIMGTSGAGKTTLLKVLSGQDDSRTTVTNGDVLIGGHTTTKLQRQNGSIIGLVEQNEQFEETMTVEEHLIFQVSVPLCLCFYFFL